jgi:hypothetical protein
MNNDDLLKKIEQMIKPLQEGQVRVEKQLDAQGKDIQGIKQDIGQLDKKIDNVEVKLSKKIDTVDMKVEAVLEYQKKAHIEIMEKIFDSNEANGQEVKNLEKRVERLENTSLKH